MNTGLKSLWFILGWLGEKLFRTRELAELEMLNQLGANLLKAGELADEEVFDAWWEAFDSIEFTTENGIMMKNRLAYIGVHYKDIVLFHKKMMEGKSIASTPETEK